MVLCSQAIVWGEPRSFLTHRSEVTDIARSKLTLHFRKREERRGYIVLLLVVLLFTNNPKGNPLKHVSFRLSDRFGVVRYCHIYIVETELRTIFYIKISRVMKELVPEYMSISYRYVYL